MFCFIVLLLPSWAPHKTHMHRPLGKTQDSSAMAGSDKGYQAGETHKEGERQTSINPSVFICRDLTRDHSMNNTFMHYSGPQQCLENYRTHLCRNLDGDLRRHTGLNLFLQWSDIWMERVKGWVLGECMKDTKHICHTAGATITGLCMILLITKTFACPQLQFKIIPKLDGKKVQNLLLGLCSFKMWTFVPYLTLKSAYYLKETNIYSSFWKGIAPVTVFFFFSEFIKSIVNSHTIQNKIMKTIK